MNLFPIDQIVTLGNIREDNKDIPQEYLDLKNNIEKVGQTTPVSVYKQGDKYCLVTGHQRLRALKELGKKEILASVVKKPTKEALGTIQLSENTFRVPMSLFEETIAMQRIASENPKATYKTLSAKFGRDINWIASRMTLANLHPHLLHGSFVYSENFKDLVKMGSVSRDRQFAGIKAYCKANSITMAQFKKEVLTDEISSWQLLRYIEDEIVTLEKMQKIFTEEEIKDYWSVYKHKTEATNLFDEVAIRYDWKFLDHCLKLKYPDRLAQWNAIPTEPLEGYDPLTSSPDFDMAFTADEKVLDKIKSWTGSFQNFKVKQKKTTTKASNLNDPDVEIAPKPRYHGCGTKLARTLIPRYLDYVAKRYEMDDRIVEWVHQYEQGDQCRPSLGKIDEGFNDLLKNFGINEIGKLTFDEYIAHCISESTILNIQRLAHKFNLDTIQKFIDKTWADKTEEKFRESLLSAFKTDMLQDEYKVANSDYAGNTKRDLCSWIAINFRKDKFRFMDVFDGDNSNFWQQRCKTYMKKD